MKTESCRDWTCIGSRPSHLWVGGVVALVNTTSGKTYFVGTRNVGKRVRDQHRWLTCRSHHNRELQNDWATEDFDFYLARRVTVPSRLKAEKQMLIDKFADSGRCYNKKRACPILKARSKPTSIEGMLLEIAEMMSS